MGLTDEAKIKRMQENLSVIRSVARWTTERLGEEIGVSRQTINSLEHNKTSMSKTQYLALRAVFNHEAMVAGNTALAQVIQTLVDEPIEKRSADKEVNGKEPEDPEEPATTMDGMSAATNILADKKAVAAIVGAITAAAVMPGITGLAVVPAVAQMLKKKGQ